MHEDLITAVDDLFPHTRMELEQLVRIPSISAAGFDPTELQRSADHTEALLEAAGCQHVRLLELPGAHPAVYGEIPGPPEAPTVLLYAHHDVQPPGDLSAWDADPFEPYEKDGRLYGRGSGDDKSGIVIHTTAIRAHGGTPPVGIKVFIEGEEEIGSIHLGDFLAKYGELLAADVIVIADAGNIRTAQPSITTSLRGLVDCVVEVRTLENAVHSGKYGGVLPDAITSLARLLATLHDDDGNVAIEGLVGSTTTQLDVGEDEIRHHSGLLEGVELIGDGPLTSRMWTQPACSVLAIDAPTIADAVNALVPVARAKVSLRLAPGDDPERGMKALVRHLEQHAPWGVSVSVTPGSAGAPFSMDGAGKAYAAFRQAFVAAWGVQPVEVGLGGSIPFVAAFADAYPEASILLVGPSDDKTRAHGPNESIDLLELKRACLAEAIALRILAT